MFLGTFTGVTGEGTVPVDELQEKIDQLVRERRFGEANQSLFSGLNDKEWSAREQLSLSIRGMDLMVLQGQWQYALDLAGYSKELFREIGSFSPQDSILRGLYLEELGDFGYEFGYASKDKPLRNQTYETWTRAMHFFPASHPRIPALHRKLGMLCRILKRTEEGKDHFLRGERALDQANTVETLRFYQHFSYFLYKTAPSRDPSNPATMPTLAMAKRYLASARNLLDTGDPTILPEDSVLQNYFEADLDKKFYGGSIRTEKRLLDAYEIIQGRKTRTYLQRYVLENLADLSQEKGQYLKAIEYRRLQEKSILNYPVPPAEYLPIYGGLGYIYDLLQDVQLEKIHYRHCLEIAREAYLEDPNYLTIQNYALYLNNMASALEDSKGEGENDPGTYLRDALTYYELLSGDGFYHPSLPNILYNLGSLKYEEAKYDSSVYYHQRSIEIQRALDSSNDYYLGLNHAGIARSELLRGHPVQATQALNASRSSLSESLDPIQLAELHTIHADYFHLKQDWSETIRSAQLALWELNGVVTVEDESSPVELDKLLERKFALNALRFKAEALKHLAHENNDRERLQHSLVAYQQSVELIHTLREQQSAQTSQVDFNNRNRPVFEAAIDVAFELFQATQDSSYLHQAFKLTEQSRGMVLLAAVSTSEAAKAAGVPDSLLLQDREYQALADSLLRQLSRSEPDEIAPINQRLVEVTDQQERLRKLVQSNYPKYYEEVFETSTVTLPEIQKDLAIRDQFLLEYFYGDSLLFIFGVGADTVVFHRKKILPEFEEALSNTQTYLRSRNVRSYGNEYAEASVRVYQALIGDLGLQLPERLLIIPDNRLNFISFEALTLKPLEDDRPRHFNHLPFLLDSHIVAYDYSYTIRKRRQPFQGVRAPQVLAMAPEFDILGLEALPYAQKTIEDLSRTFRHVHTIQGESATETSFRQQVGEFAIIDLATHGKMDSLNSSDCRLYFGRDSLNDGMLHLGELYNLNLNARMAILEACESGLGPNARGEGVMSMARGFSYAGCNTIVTSLWNVADEEMTFEVMKSFYRHLSEGLPVDESLALAKRNYLAQNRKSPGQRAKYYQPFFWAEMIVIGDTSPVDLQRNTTFEADKASIWVGLFLLGALVVYLLRRRLKTNKTRSNS